MKPVFDFSDGDYCYEISDNMLMDSDGNLMQNMGGGMAMDMNSSELHIMDGSSSYSNHDEDDWM